MRKYISILACLSCLTMAAQQPQRVAAVTAAAPETYVQYISGTDAASAVDWEFFCTDGRNSGKWTTIKVPSCWELQGFGTYQYGMPFYGKANPPGIAKEQGFYKTRFKLPSTWEGRQIRIVFDGVMTDCSVNINSRRAIKLHQGSFYRFSADITDRVFFGEQENLLEVTVSKESANESVNLAERRADYWNFGGIYRPVYIEAVPVNHIERTAIDARSGGDFRAEVYLGNGEDDGDWYILTTITDVATGKRMGSMTNTRFTGDKALVEVQVKNASDWTAETPNLYKAEFCLMHNGTPLHKVYQKFGFRTIEVRDHDGLYINGNKVLAKGVNRHSFRPETGRALSREDCYADVRLIKEMNMNAVRMSHYPPDEAFLEACDELGLYVMDELGGWHGKYDTEVGSKLVPEMITRDVNHPSIIWWSNGNEGGFNYELEPLFYQYDPQKRTVIYPWENRNKFETKHYRSYGESQEYMRKPEIFMPTEFLHGLYDGGHGAGLWDYWEMMRLHPRSAGGFLWVFADEGVMRTDQNGRIDNVGNYGADGIVGPHHEKEGSFNTIRQVWSPIHIAPAGNVVKAFREEASWADQNSFIADTKAFAGKFDIENRYDFINLKSCTFSFELARMNRPSDDKAGHTVIAKGSIASPDVAPHSQGTLSLNLPATWNDADVLYVTAYNPEKEPVYTWGFYWKDDKEFCQTATQAGKVTCKENKEEHTLTVTTGKTDVVFDTQTGYLKRIGDMSLSNGPRFIAARRGDRSMDVFYNHDDKQARSKERIYQNISGTSELTGFTYEEYSDHITIKATYFGNLQEVEWTIDGNGNLTANYTYQYEGNVELCGVCFDYPESKVQGARFLAKGPYRVWQNRLHGTVMDVWETDYNDPIPGETFTYPEFKGYYNDWKWCEFKTTEGKLVLNNGTRGSYLGIFTPRDGRDVLLYTLPQSGIAILDVIPGVRNKVNSTDLVGPSSGARWLTGPQKGSFTFYIR